MILDYDEYHLSTIEKRKLSLAVVLLLAAVSIIFYNTLFPVVFSPLAYILGIKHLEEILAVKRKNKLLLQFKDFLYSISSSVATGRHMSQAIEEAKVNLRDIYSDKDLIMLEISEMSNRLKKGNQVDSQVLKDFAKRCKLEDVTDFVEIYNICKTTGGNLILAVDKGANIIGDKITIENEIRTMTSQKKFEGKIITAMPIITILFLRMMSPDYLEIMYVTLGGRVLMTFALLATGLAYLAIERITTIEV
ncbi:MAG: hypothetical protein RR769_02030 [Anaerovoracaceae bacterium]